MSFLLIEDDEVLVGGHTHIRFNSGYCVTRAKRVFILNTLLNVLDFNLIVFGSGLSDMELQLFRHYWVQPNLTD